MNEPTSIQVAAHLSNALALLLWKNDCIMVNEGSPFRLASGNSSPIYVNCRRAISSPSIMDLFVAASRVLIVSDKVDFGVLAGGETAGIPFAAALARALSVPMVYVRKATKEHGLATRIEGVLSPKARILLVEDLLTDAGSKIGFLDAIADAGGVAKDVLVLFDRLQGGREALAARGVALHALTDMKVALSVAEQTGLASPETLTSVRDYLLNPRQWHDARKLHYHAH